MKLSQIILLVFSLIAVVFEGYLGIYTLVGFVIQVIFISAVSALLLYSIGNKSKKSYTAILGNNLLLFSSVIGVLFSIVASVLVYHNSFPARLDDVTLSDGTTTVQFLSMSHIATEDFYTDKNTHIMQLADEGYTILVEGVQPGSDESTEKFDAYMGFKFTETLYETFSTLLGMQSQNNTKLYLGVSPGSLISVDLSLDEIVASLALSGATMLEQEDIPDVEKDLLLLIPQLSPQERNIVSYAGRALLNWSLKNAHDIQAAIMAGDTSELFATILDKRNEVIIEYISTHPGEKIVIVYGALHFNGIYEGLQRISPQWNILNIVPKYPYQQH